MLWANNQGVIHGGEKAPGDIQINSKPTYYHKLKTNWQQTVPDVWELDLAVLKTASTNAIDSKTDDLIAQGFTFQSLTFSLSTEAQQKLMIIQNLATMNVLDPVTPLSTLDNHLYDLQRADAPAFVAAAYTRLSSLLTTGSTLKGSIMAATDEAAVNAVVDSRT
jgi:hypothetical protein